MSFLLLGAAGAVQAQEQAALEVDFAGALRGCEEWILNPASWSEGLDPFIAKVGLGNRMGLVDEVHEASLPPESLRLANHYWRINTSESAGFVLVVSDRLPMCHITGGGDVDLQPAIASVLASQAFGNRWERVEGCERSGMTSTLYRHRLHRAFAITVSHAAKPGARRDRVQLLATATYQLGD